MWSQKTPADKSRPLSSLQPSPSSFLYCVVFVFPAPNKCERCSWVRGRRSLKVCSGGVNIHPSEHTTEEYLHTSQSLFFQDLSIRSGPLQQQENQWTMLARIPSSTWGGGALLAKKPTISPFSRPIHFVLPHQYNLKSSRTVQSSVPHRLPVGGWENKA